MRLFCSLFLLLWIPCEWLLAQEVQNGSLEENTATCGINLQNEIFNRQISFVEAFGEQNEIDLLQDSCGYGEAVDGKFYAALYASGSSDALSFALSEPLDPTRTYRIRFAARRGDGTFESDNKILLGLSMQSDAFGDLQNTFRATQATWEYTEYTFVPDRSYAYVTFQTSSQETGWLYLDDVSILCPTIDLGPDTIMCEVMDLPLAVESGFDAYLWSDGTRQSDLTVARPGTYWVEVREGDCVIRDSIQIREYENNCECEMLFPNAFSPNSSVGNEKFYVKANCTLIRYEIQIYNRWGILMFESEDIHDAWDGMANGQLAPNGVYMYNVTYRFPTQTRERIARASFTLLR
ncbi:MAG: gliding motility-associated C-terminal domain-containing protein [Bacteroidota bacterium]